MVEAKVKGPRKNILKKFNEEVSLIDLSIERVTDLKTNRRIIIPDPREDNVDNILLEVALVGPYKRPQSKFRPSNLDFQILNIIVVWRTTRFLLYFCSKKMYLYLYLSLFEIKTKAELCLDIKQEI